MAQSAKAPGNPNAPAAPLPRPGRQWPQIGALRWKVTLCYRKQSAGPASAISEDFRDCVDTHADIQPIGLQTFMLASQTSMMSQTDTPITHLIRLRWEDYVETTYVIFRTSKRHDNTNRTEIFRVRRCKELAGRKRFCELECELEQVHTTEGDSHAERLALFAEYPRLAH